MVLGGEHLLEAPHPVRIGDAHARQVHEVAHLAAADSGPVQVLDQLARPRACRFPAPCRAIRRTSMNCPGSTMLPLSSRMRTRISDARAQVGEAHHRLAVQHQPVVVEHVAQLVRPVHAVVRAAQIVRRPGRSSTTRLRPPSLAWYIAMSTLDSSAGDVAAVERVERDADRGGERRQHPADRTTGSGSGAAHRAGSLANLHRVAAQGVGQVHGELVAAQAEDLAVEVLDAVLQHAANSRSSAGRRSDGRSCR